MPFSFSTSKISVIGRSNFLPTRNQAQNIIIFTLFFAFCSCVTHLVIGADTLVICIAFTAFSLSLYPVYILGFLDIGAVLIALVGFRYVGFPIFAKLVFNQALDTNLYDPIGSFGITLIGIIGYLLAFQSTTHMPFRRPILTPNNGNKVLTKISILAAIIGTSANAIVAFRVNEDYTGVTIANFFVSFLHLALISAIARVALRTKGRRSIDLWVMIIFAIEIEFAMIFNSRMGIMETFLCWVVTSISFETKIEWKHIIVTVTMVILMVTFITPVFFYLRGFRTDLSWDQRTNSTIQIASQWRDAIDHHMDWKALIERFGWHRSYYGKPSTVFERMSYINDADILKNGTDLNTNVGTKDLLISLKRVLPRFISPDKPSNYGQGAWLLSNIGIPDPGPYPSAPLIGTGYVAFGWKGSFLYPFLLGITWLTILKYISGFSLRRNIWTIYLLIRCHNQFVEGSSDAYLEHILRILPQDFILLCIVSFLSTGRFLKPIKKEYYQAYVK